MATWIDYTRRNDPAQPVYVARLQALVASRPTPDVLCFWTKAPGYIARHYGPLLSSLQTVVAQVTWNTGYDLLEPNVTHDVADLAALVDLLGPSNVRLRFDPIIPGFTSPAMFRRCVTDAATVGITRITINFLVPSYKRVGALLQQQFGINATRRIDRAGIIGQLVSMAGDAGIELAGCAELYRDGVPGLIQSGCSDANWVPGLTFTPRPSRSGCLCCYSGDWGNYQDPPCPHGCVYCYAK